jgi:hypothetical protein
MSYQLRSCGAAQASTAPARAFAIAMPPNPACSRPFAPLRHRPTPPRCVRAAVSIKIKDYGDLGDFELAAEAKEILEAYLGHPAFCQNVRDNLGWPEGVQARYAGQLFQPVPWSATTRRGMPPEMEQFADSPDHAIINIPPPFMFKAKIFNPSRLCAVYERVEAAADAEA